LPFTFFLVARTPSFLYHILFRTPWKCSWIGPPPLRYFSLFILTLFVSQVSPYMSICLTRHPSSSMYHSLFTKNGPPNPLAFPRQIFLLFSLDPRVDPTPIKTFPIALELLRRTARAPSSSQAVISYLERFHFFRCCARFFFFNFPQVQPVSPPSPPASPRTFSF